LSPPRLDQPFVAGSIQTQIGAIPRISSQLEWADRLGAYKARWGIGRMHYTVDPGLYALGNPNDQSPVFVTANYKMSFDRLRHSLRERSGWIIVLDTKGINVWCAAGKGTFGTAELVSRIESSGLKQIVAHRELILPQLGAPGVSAHQVTKLSGFNVIYGPIRADDLPAFFDAGLKAAPAMRQKSFTIQERIALIPMELLPALKKAFFIILAFLFVSFLAGAGKFGSDAFRHGLYSIPAILTAILAGAVLTPLLLPWMPGKTFSFKGLVLGFLAGVLLTASRWGNGVLLADRLEMAAWFFLIPALSAFLAMNFTGASTYTSLSGVKKEMRRAVPLEIGGGVIGIILWIGSIFTGFAR
jgi:hypothetical protein